MKGKLKVLKALEMSIFRTTFPPKLLLFKCFIASKVRHILSLMLVPLTNHFFSRENKTWRIVESISSMILVTLLCLKLARVIGLKRFKLLASLILAIRTIMLTL